MKKAILTLSIFTALTAAAHATPVACTTDADCCEKNPAICKADNFAPYAVHTEGYELKFGKNFFHCEVVGGKIDCGDELPKINCDENECSFEGKKMKGYEVECEEKTHECNVYSLKEWKNR